MKLTGPAFVRNAVVANSAAQGIVLDGTPPLRQRQRLLNCTVVRAGTHGLDIGPLSDASIQNSIVADSADTAIQFVNAGQTLDFDGVVIHDRSQEEPAIKGTNAPLSSGTPPVFLHILVKTIADPAALFTGYAAGDYRLAPLSEARKYGDPNAIPPVDFLRRERPQIDLVDAGAFVFIADANAARDWTLYR
jgi:hypothetical protein